MMMISALSPFALDGSFDAAFGQSDVCDVLTKHGGDARKEGSYCQRASFG